MTSTPFRRAVAMVGALAALAGLVDAARGGQADLAVVFAFVLVTLLILLASSFIGRRPFGVRADLARWLEQRAATTGEPADRILDRAVADHRDRVSGGVAEGERARSDMEGTS